MFQIVFEYHTEEGKWEIYAVNAESELEAVQGFNAVLITMRMTIPTDEHRAEPLGEKKYKINVAIPR